SSKSWLGYQASLYYRDFRRAPVADQFSIEWGLSHPLGYYQSGNWREATFDEVSAHIFQLAKDPDRNSIDVAAKAAADAFQRSKSRMQSLLSILVGKHPSDDRLKELLDEVKTVYI